MNPNIGRNSKTRVNFGINSGLRDALHNDQDTTLVLQRERPVHRRMAEMALQGYTNAEIGGLLGYKEPYVSRVLRQPFIRQHMIEAAKRDTNQELHRLIEEEGLKALRRVVAVAESLDPDSFRPPSKHGFDANIELVNRLLGKAVQPFRNETKDPKKLTDEQLDREIERRLAGTAIGETGAS